MNDETEIIRRVKAGDTEAYRALVVRYERPVHAFLAGLIADRHEVEDLAQEVFLSAFRALDRYDPDRGRFSTWLFTIARNRGLNAARKIRDRPADLSREPSRDGDPLARAEEREIHRRLDAEVRDLPEDQRAAFLLKEFAGLNSDQIGQMEGIPAGTIRSRLSRARARLRTVLTAFVGGSP